MKRNSSYAVLFAVLLASCQTEPTELGLAPGIVAKVESQAETKTILSVDESGVGTVYWTPSDQIDVFFGTVKARYTSQNESNAKRAEFKTDDNVTGAAESTNIWGLYPPYDGSSCDGSSVTTYLPNIQYGIPNSFDNGLFITLAHSSSTTLQFYNVCGGVKFSLSRDDIKLIRLRGNNYEYMAGEISLSFQNDRPEVNVLNGIREITLTPKEGGVFLKDVDYYFVTLPCTLTDGFTMEFLTTAGERGTFHHFAGGISIRRAIFSKKARIDGFASFTDDTIPVPEAIDLGLSVKWASFNLGASKPEEYGHYYSWGELMPKLDYSLETYRWGDPPSKYNQTDGLRVLEPEDDVAHMILQGNWRMPTTEEDEELYTMCTREYIQVNGVYGYKFTGPNGNSIFLPTSGLYDGSSYLDGVNEWAWYWSSTLDSSDYSCARGFHFASDSFNYGDGDHNRCDGHVIRPVEDSGGSVPAGPNGMVYYTSSDGSIVTPYSADGFGARIVSNEYVDGRGVISFNRDVTSIGSYAFQNCDGLTSITIPDSVTNIGRFAFYQCTDLSGGLTIPAGVVSIGDSAFQGCAGMTDITFLNETPPSGSASMFSDAGFLIYVPEGSVDTYKTAEYWSDYADRIHAIPSVPIPDLVDLGLSVKWATFNFGASRAEDYGNYYAWGETETKNSYRWTAYKFWISGISNDNVKFSKYNTDSSHGTVDNLTTLEADDDVVNKVFGGNWHIPSESDFAELRDNDNCTWTWTTLNGVKGYKVSSNLDGYTGTWIFIPAAGNMDGDANLVKAGTNGYYLSSTLSTYVWCSTCLFFDSSSVNRGGGFRYNGLSIRPVYAK